MSWRSIPVLAYHNIDGQGNGRSVNGHPLDYFKRHLDVVCELGFKTISAQHLFDICVGKRKHDKKYIALTFDDCHLSHWLYAIPLLAERNMNGIFFTVTDFIWEGPKRGFESAPLLLDPSESFKNALINKDYTQFMNWAELESSILDYGMEIYAHSCIHQACFKNLKFLGNFSEQFHWSLYGIYHSPKSNYPIYERGSALAYNGFWPRVMHNELTFKLRSDNERFNYCLNDFSTCYRKIRQLNKLNTQFFCWPWGQFDTLSMQALQEAGFTGSFTLERTRNGRGKDPFRLSRIIVGRTNSHKWLRTRLLMHYPSIGANLFFKYFRKKNEVKNVMYMTDSRHISGGTRQLLNNVLAMQHYGVNTYVVSIAGSSLETALRGTKAHIIVWDSMNSIMLCAIKLVFLARKNNIHVIHTFHSRAVKIAVLAKLLGGGFRLYINRGVISSPNWLIGIFARISNGVICNSQRISEVLQKYLVPQSRINIVYNSFVGVSPEAKPAGSGNTSVVFVGNSNPVKGYDVFVQTVSEYYKNFLHRNIDFVACGIPKDNVFKVVAHQDPAGITLLGSLSFENIQRVLNTSSIFLLSSRREGMPNTLLEAFNASLPVVCTNVGGVNELIRHGLNGLLCESQNPHILAHFIRFLVNHPEEREKFGKLNKKIVSEYLTNTRKGYSLLRVYSGENVHDAIPFDKLNNGKPLFSIFQIQEEDEGVKRNGQILYARGIE
ncbi:MAG: glycosyltransferase [bacterium]